MFFGQKIFFDDFFDEMFSLFRFGKESQTLEPQRNNSFLSFSPLWDQRSADECQMLTESTRGPSLQYGTREGLFSYLFSRLVSWREVNGVFLSIFLIFSCFENNRDL